MRLARAHILRMAPLLFFCLSVLLCWNDAHGQVGPVRIVEEDGRGMTVEVTAKWTTGLNELKAKYERLSDETVLYFVDGALTESMTIPLPSLGVPEVQLLASDYDEISIETGEDGEIPAFLSQPPAQVINVGYERRQPAGTFVGRLVTYDAERQVLRRYRRITAHIRYVGETAGESDIRASYAVAGAANPHLQVARSVLAEGTWFKIPVTRDGVYRIDADYLEGLGLSASQIDPDHIRIFGNGGKMLPALNSAPRPADLIENPVYARGGGDGSFGSGDYVLFYGSGPGGWDYNRESVEWQHFIHLFSNENYYFMWIDGGEGAKVGEASYPGLSGAVRLNSFQGRFFLHEDIENLGQEGSGSGLDWLGPRLDVNTAQRTVLDTMVSVRLPGEVTYRSRIAVRSNPAASLLFSSPRGELRRVTPGPVTLQGIGAQTGYAARPAETSFIDAVPEGQPLQLDLVLEGRTNGPQGWLDWLEVHYPSRFVAANNTLKFSTPAGESGRFEMRLTGFSAAPHVWDVSEPGSIRRLGIREDGDGYLVQVEVTDGADPRNLLAFTPTGDHIRTPSAGERVSNQNLHGIATYPDLVIVTPAAFQASAEALAEYRRGQGLLVEVADVEHVYNEFSGGVPDMRAVRDYLKFLYDRAPDQDRLLKYALLFGGGHYDFRNITGQHDEERNQNWILTYQTDETLWRIQSYTSDDYFGLLDDNEGVWAWPAGGDAATSFERVDVGVGRLPIQTPQEAALVVEKIKHYESSASYGSWRTRYTFAADDGPAGSRNDYDLHTDNAEMVARLVEDQFPEVNQNKIYAISYPAITVAGGRRIPGAKDDILRSIEDGTLVWNFSGHGGFEGLADERLFMIEDIRRLENYDRLTVFVTATCSFGKFDMARNRSGAEELLINPRGGAVALFTTVRLVYTVRNPDAYNVGVNRQLNRFLLSRDEDGRPRRLGDIMRLTKNTEPGAQANNRKFNLLGDPSLRIGLPEREVTVSKVNGISVEEEMAQLKALSLVNLEGEVIGFDGYRDATFSGIVELSVYDAARTVTIPEELTRVLRGYDVQNDLIYRGRVRAEQGFFRAEFVVPKDISYSNESGKIAVYAQSSEGDGYGGSTNVIVGGTASSPLVDTEGPIIDVFLNDTTFISGGLTGATPKLIVKLFDESGINTVGTGVGHEMLLVVNNDERSAVDLSSRFVADLDSYQSGEVQYPMPEFERGPHTLSVKAWDVLNNSNTAELDFFVVPEATLALNNVFNYPNPTSGNTRFIFEHNQPAGTPASVQVRIYTIAGRPIRTIDSMEALPQGMLPGGPVQIPWDGRDDDFDTLATGVYLYKIRVEVDGDGLERQVSEKIERLAIIR